MSLDPPRKKASAAKAQRPLSPPSQPPSPPPQPQPPRRARITPLPPQFPNDWAVAYGEDAHGLWQAFEVAGVRQVMRWIPPGSFTMGSATTEPGRWDDEAEHPVRLTVGLWLADTTCTQAFWAAVMGDANPSPSLSFGTATLNGINELET